VRLITPPKTVEFVCVACTDPPIEERKQHVSTQVQTVQDVVQVPSEGAVSMLSRLSISMGDDSSGKLQNMQQADRPGTSDLLFAEMPSGRVTSNANTPLTPVRALQDDVQAEEGWRQAVLFEDLRGEMDGPEEAASERPTNNSRLHSSARTRSSDGGQWRICDGASPSDGKSSQSDATANRGGSPCQWQEERQPHRKPPTNDPNDSQRFAEGNHQERDRVSALRNTASVIQHCPTCGSPLIAKERRGLVLDPFAGTGTLGEAAFREGMRAVLIEREEEYQADIRRRMALVLAGPDERMCESIKAKNLPRDDGPLFDWREGQ
jgi:hypothetical protein